VHVGLVEWPEAGILIAPVGQVDDEPGRLAANEGARRTDAPSLRAGRDESMQNRRVRGVDAALERLEPVALLDHFRHVAVGCRRLRPGELGQGRLEIRRAHVRPDDAAQLDRGIGRLADLVLEGELFRLVHHVHAAAADVELPAVVDAPQPALLVTAEEQRGAPMRAELFEESDAPLGVTKGHQVLAEELDAHGRAVGFR
jgi:hypothetical protein